MNKLLSLINDTWSNLSTYEKNQIKENIKMNELLSLIQEIDDTEILDEIIYESNSVYEFIQGMKAELEQRTINEIFLK